MMEGKISTDLKETIDKKVFFKFVSFNTANEEEMEKTLALNNFLKEDGERIFKQNSSD
ncbi:MAG: hypothetical protein ACJZ8I_01265 [Paracoccaceae bacterium]